MTHLRLLVNLGAGAALWLAAARALRGDVLVLTNGSLLLGRVQSVTDAGIEVALGSAGTTTVRKSDLKLLIPCPPNEEPDSLLKAGERAERSGLAAEALACYEKSLAVEPANAIAATSRRADLQKRIVSNAQARPGAAQANSVEARRAEAQRLIHEGDQMIARGNIAAGFRAPHTGSAESSVTSWGATLKAQGEEMKKRGQQMLAQIGQDTAPPSPARPSSAASSAAAVNAPAATPAAEPTVGEQGVNWLKIGGVIVVVLIVVRVLFHPFFPRK